MNANNPNDIASVNNELIHGNLRNMYETMIRSKAFLIRINPTLGVNEDEATRRAIYFIAGSLIASEYRYNPQTDNDINFNKRKLCQIRDYLASSLDMIWSTLINGSAPQELQRLTVQRQREIIIGAVELSRELRVYIEPGGPCHQLTDERIPDLPSNLFNAPRHPPDPNSGSAAAGGKPRKPRKSGKKQKAKKLRKSKKHSKYF